MYLADEGWPEAAQAALLARVVTSQRLVAHLGWRVSHLHGIKSFLTVRVPPPDVTSRVRGCLRHAPGRHHQIHPNAKTVDLEVSHRMLRVAHLGPDLVWPCPAQELTRMWRRTLTMVRHAGRPDEGRGSLAGQAAHIEARRPATSVKVASAHVRDHPLIVCGGARSHRARLPTPVAFWRVAHDRRACPFRATKAVCTRRLGRPGGISAARARGSTPRGGTAAGPPPRGSRRRRAAHPAASADGPVCTPSRPSRPPRPPDAPAAHRTVCPT